MAEKYNQAGVLARVGTSAKRWAASFISPSKQINQSGGMELGAWPTTVASLLRGGKRQVRTRDAIYGKWSEMESDAIVSTALSLLVTSALGGNETSGDIVYIETKASAKSDKRLASIAEEVSKDLSRIFNKSAYQLAYIGAAYGDAYARIYMNATGVVDLSLDELYRPQLVQPYERGSRTVGYGVYVGKKYFERLDVSQLARMKMPRTYWVPQQGIVEKAQRLAVTENDIDNLPIMPSMAGGSLLFNAEEAYDNLTASLLGLVGQRWMDAIDESIVSVQMESMSGEQQDRFIESVKTMFTASKIRADAAVKSGRPIMERIRHIIPIFNDKQAINIVGGGAATNGRTGNITIDDVMLHARMLAGAVGVDLSLLGFADQLSGGLGDGGFFRVSAQAAERSRVIRVALEACFNSIIDVHTQKRYGVVFDESERPWEIQFYGSISALEAERQRTRTDAMNAGMLLAQSMQVMRDLGANKEIMETFLTKTMLLDEEQAAVFAKIVDVKPQEDGGGGGFGG